MLTNQSFTAQENKIIDVVLNSVVWVFNKNYIMSSLKSPRRRLRRDSYKLITINTDNERECEHHFVH